MEKSDVAVVISIFLFVIGLGLLLLGQIWYGSISELLFLFYARYVIIYNDKENKKRGLI